MSLLFSRRIVTNSPKKARHAVNTNTHAHFVRFSLESVNYPAIAEPTPVEAYLRLASLIVFLPCVVTLQGCWGLKYPRWKQTPGLPLCSISFLSVLFISFPMWKSSRSALIEVGREYYLHITGPRRRLRFSHSIVADRFVLYFFFLSYWFGPRRVVAKPQTRLTSAISVSRFDCVRQRSRRTKGVRVLCVMNATGCDVRFAVGPARVP